MWIFGFHPVREALIHRPAGVLRVLVHRGRRDARFAEIETLCDLNEVILQKVERSDLEARADGAHNGFVAEMSETGSKHLPQARQDPGELIVLVEDLQDPRNFGALLRVCDAAGVLRVLVRDRGSTGVTPTVVKTSAGAAEWLPIERITNSVMTLERLKKEGYWVYGAVAGGQPPWEIDLSGKVVVCIGGESKGLRRRTRETCDALVGVPMRGQVSSLNLATAAAAILFEVVRQQGSVDA